MAEKSVEEGKEKFEPVIVGFFCRWCTSEAADLAGTIRLQYPPNIRPIRVMCSGFIDPIYVLKAFLEGADGVLIGGCHLGECHYINGNYKAQTRVKVIKEVMKSLGLEEERLRLEWISTSEGLKFAEVANEFTEQIRQMGPNPLKKLKRE